jgi:hypothetical protein
MNVYYNIMLKIFLNLYFSCFKFLPIINKDLINNYFYLKKKKYFLYDLNLEIFILNLYFRKFYSKYDKHYI